MADFAIFGPAASGARLFEQDQMKKAEHQATMAMVPYKIDELSSQTDMQRAHAEAYRQTAREHALKVEQEEKFNRFLEGAMGKVDQSLDHLDQLDEIAEKAAQSGFITKALKINSDVATIRNRKAQEQAALSRAEKTLLESRLKETDAILSVMGDGKGNLAVLTPEDWAVANQMYSVKTGRPSPFSALPFSAVPQLWNSAMSVKEQTDRRLRENQQQETATYRRSRLSQMDADREIRNARLRVMQEREARLAKDGGGKAVAGPSNAEIRQAERLIKEGVPGMDAKDLEEAAYAIASDARELRSKNKALGSDTALRQAIEAAKSSGQFEASSRTIGGFRIPFTERTRLSREGLGPEAPMALPKEESELKPGRFYRLPQGVGRWNAQKKKFELVAPAGGAPLSGGNGNPDSATDDEDGEDE